MSRVDVVDSLKALEELRPEWLELWQTCPRATPFQSPQWLLPWTTYLFGGGCILALAVRDSCRLIGFAPMFRWGTGRQTISFLGAGISDYGDVLFAPGRESESVSAVRSFLGDECAAGHALDLRELRGDAGLLDDWPAEACSVCPVLALSGFPGTMDPKHRVDVRRARNKLSRDPDVRFMSADDSTFPWCMNEFFRLHEARWGTIGDSLRRFHLDAARNFLETGNLRLSLLRIGEPAAAAVYAFQSGKTLYCYLSGFDPDLAKLSPGAVLLGWVIEQAAAEGLKEVDFLRDQEAYKYLWGARDRVNYTIRCAAPEDSPAGA